MIVAATNAFEWGRERIGVIIFVLFFVTQVLRGVWRAYQARQPAATARPDALEEERRAKEIRAEIERRKSVRRVQNVPAEPPMVPGDEPLPPPRRANPETTQMPEPFGGPLRRILEELQREARPPESRPLPSATPVVVEKRTGELQRQEDIAERMRSVEESRVLVQRRAAHRAADKSAEAQSEPGLRTAARDNLLGELRDPEHLRRAFVLREVLGPPVGLR